jgi:hypothetical protein
MSDERQSDNLTRTPRTLEGGHSTLGESYLEIGVGSLVVLPGTLPSVTPHDLSHLRIHMRIHR